MIALEKKTARGIWVNRDVSEIHADLEAELREANLWEALDYFDITSAIKQKRSTRFPEFRWIACFPVFEPDQGCYIHVEAITVGKKSQLVFIGKTVKGFGVAATVANKCAELFGAPHRLRGRAASSKQRKKDRTHRQLSVRLPSDAVAALEKLGGSKSQHLEKALAIYLDKTSHEATG